MRRLLGIAFPILLVAFAALGVLGPVASPDAFWHVAAGRWILDHGEIPHHDPFRFTSIDEPWVDHEWGFQLLLGWADAFGGVGGWVALRCAVFALLAWMLWRLGRRIVGDGRTTPAVALSALAVVLLVTLEGLPARAPVRPELLTLLAFVALLWLLEADRGRPAAKGSLRLWIAAPLLVVAWANVHPGVLAAAPIAFLHLLGRRLEALGTSPADPPPWRRVFGLPTLLVLAIGANPWGFEVLLLPLRIRSALADLPASNPDWRPIWADPPWLLVLALLVVLAATFLLRRRGVRADLPSGLVLLGACGLAVVGLRFTGLAWIALYVFVAHLLRQRPQAREAEETELVARLRAAFPALVLAVLLLGTALELWSAGFRTVGVAPDRFPGASVDLLQTLDGVGNLYNSAVFGGYVLHRAFPPRQVFLDTRNEVNPQILRDLAAARSDARKWHALVERWDLDAALLRYEDRPRPVLGPPAVPGGEPTVEHHTTSALLFPRDEWALVHWDDVSMLFLRRRPEQPDRTEQIRSLEYRHVQPEDVDAVLRRAAADPAFRAGLAADLRRKLAEDPGSERARRIAAASGSI